MKPKPNFYDNLEEAQRRLLRTVVMYDGLPCYIWDIRGPLDDGILRLYITPLPFAGGVPTTGDTEDAPNVPGAATRRRIDSPKFNHFRPIELGYINYFGVCARGISVANATYSYRIPVRQNRQGLNAENCSFYTIPSNAAHRIPFGEVITTDAFLDMVRGDYPSWDEVLPLLKESTSIAVDRQFAIYKNTSGFNELFYKTDAAGIVAEDGSIFLPAKKSYLRELIQECPNLSNNIRSI